MPSMDTITMPSSTITVPSNTTQQQEFYARWRLLDSARATSTPQADSTQSPRQNEADAVTTSSVTSGLEDLTIGTRPYVESDPSKHKKTKIFVISDTHEHDLPHTTERFDVALFLGDHTEASGREAFRRFIAQTKAIKADNKFLIAGNHEYSLDPTFDALPNTWGKKTRYLPRKPRAYGDRYLTRKEAQSLCSGAGIEFLDRGHHTFRLKNGTTCEIFADSYTRASKNGFPGFKYMKSTGHIFDIPSTVHIVMTHGPPKDILDPRKNDKQAEASCSQLRAAVAKSRPLLHAFGHNHWGAGVLLATWDGKEGSESLALYDERHTRNSKGKGEEKGTTATKEDIVTTEDLKAWTASNRPKCYAIGAREIVKSRHTLFVNAAYETGVQKEEKSGNGDYSRIESKYEGKSLPGPNPSGTNVAWVVEIDLPLTAFYNENARTEPYFVEPGLSAEICDSTTRIKAVEDEQKQKDKERDLEDQAKGVMAGISRARPGWQPSQTSTRSVVPLLAGRKINPSAPLDGQPDLSAQGAACGRNPALAASGAGHAASLAALLAAANTPVAQGQQSPLSTPRTVGGHGASSSRSGMSRVATTGGQNGPNDSMSDDISNAPPPIVSSSQTAQAPDKFVAPHLRSQGSRPSHHTAPPTPNGGRNASTSSRRAGQRTRSDAAPSSWDRGTKPPSPDDSAARQPNSPPSWGKGQGNAYKPARDGDGRERGIDKRWRQGKG